MAKMFSYSPARSSFSTGSRTSAEPVPRATKIWKNPNVRIRGHELLSPHKKSGLNSCSEQDHRVSGFRLGRPRAEAHIWGKGARILTEINRLTQLIPHLTAKSEPEIRRR
jgi:hypothetical protein